MELGPQLAKNIGCHIKLMSTDLANYPSAVPQVFIICKNENETDAKHVPLQ